MAYRIRGLDPAQFSDRFAMNDDDLAKLRSRREFAGSTGRYPCRVSLRDADPGEELLLAYHANHAVDTPYRHAFAIYVRRTACEAAEYVDGVPPILRARPIAFRCYDAGGNLNRAALSLADDVDCQVRELFEDGAIDYIDAHNAMHGCFAARIERHGEAA